MSIDTVERAEDMVTICSAAGTWEPRCRHAWVGRHHKGHSLTQLLELCGSSADCAFELLDQYADPDVVVQLQRCERYAREHAQDCIGHAMQRWYDTRPSAEDYARVAPLVPQVADDLGGYWLAQASFCMDLGSCAQARGQVMARCEFHSKALEHSGESGRRVRYCHPPSAQNPPMQTPTEAPR